MKFGFADDRLWVRFLFPCGGSTFFNFRQFAEDAREDKESLRTTLKLWKQTLLESDIYHESYPGRLIRVDEISLPLGEPVLES
jgi:hypothetical protein